MRVRGPTYKAVIVLKSTRFNERPRPSIKQVLPKATHCGELEPNKGKPFGMYKIAAAVVDKALLGDMAAGCNTLSRTEPVRANWLLCYMILGSQEKVEIESCCANCVRKSWNKLHPCPSRVLQGKATHPQTVDTNDGETGRMKERLCAFTLQHGYRMIVVSLASY